MRTPSSWVRCATLYAITLYNPIAASTSANRPNAENIEAPSRQERVCSPIT